MVCSESASQFGNVHSLVVSKHLQANVLFKIYLNLFQSLLLNGLFRICQSIWQCPLKHVLCLNICRHMFYSKFTSIYFNLFYEMVCPESASPFGNVHLSTCCVQTFVGKCFIQNLPQFISIFIIKWSVPNLPVNLAMSI